MKIEVLGVGCAKCKKLEKNVRTAVEKLSLTADVRKVEDVNEIMAKGVMMTPALAVNGKIVGSGRVLGTDEIVGLLKQEMNAGT